MKTLTVRGIEIGSGRPKIIAPIVGSTAKEVLEKSRELANLPIDAVEWRADFFEDLLQQEQTLPLLSQMREILGGKILLFTIRTKNEGGEADLTVDKYTALNAAAAESGHVDLIDVEAFAGDDVVRQNLEAIHKSGVAVVASNHDFHSTPPVEELVSRLRKMQELDADILKIAVMPTSMADVLNLFSATCTMREKYGDRPLITISMSPKGVISRLAGEVFGSAMTFGSVGQASAPGQIPVEKLKTVLDILHESL